MGAAQAYRVSSSIPLHLVDASFVIDAGIPKKLSDYAVAANPGMFQSTFLLDDIFRALSGGNLLIPAQTYSSLILGTSGLLAYWRLGEAAGTNAADSSGNGRVGTYTGGFTLNQPGAITGDNDGAVTVDGSTGRITTGYSPFVAATTLTLEGWAKRPTNTVNHPMLGGVTSRPILRCAGGSNNIEWWPGANSVTWANAALLNQWFHWALTYNDSTRVSELFINGSSKGQLTPTTGFGTNEAIELGARSGVTEFFSGSLDEVAIYNRALSGAEILAHYQLGALTNYQAP